MRLIDDWRNAHKFATTWVAAFWGMMGAGLSVLPFLINMDNIWWLGPLILFIAATVAIARFTRQPGLES